MKRLARMIKLFCLNVKIAVLKFRFYVSWKSYNRIVY